MSTIDSMRRRALRLLLLTVPLLGGLAHPSRAEPRRSLRVPVQTWAELEPYIRANVVPFTREGALEVFACEGVQDASVVQPFDESRSAFAKVLILQSIQRDRALRKALVGFTKTFRDEPHLWKDKEATELRSEFWDRLAVAPDVYPRLRHHFEKAAGKGRLRCWICEKSETFAPPGLRELEEHGARPASVARSRP